MDLTPPYLLELLTRYLLLDYLDAAVLCRQQAVRIIRFALVILFMLVIPIRFLYIPLIAMKQVVVYHILKTNVTQLQPALMEIMFILL